MTLLGGVVSAAVASAGNTHVHGPITRVHRDSHTIRSVVELYRAHYPHRACPSIQDLVREDFFSSSCPAPLHDPWELPYGIDCFGEQDIEIRSAGPDGVFETGDDVAWERHPRSERVSEPDAEAAACVGGEGC